MAGGDDSSDEPPKKPSGPVGQIFEGLGDAVVEGVKGTAQLVVDTGKMIYDTATTDEGKEAAWETAKSMLKDYAALTHPLAPKEWKDDVNNRLAKWVKDAANQLKEEWKEADAKDQEIRFISKKIGWAVIAIITKKVAPKVKAYCGKSRKKTTEVYHVTTNPQATQGVLNGIDPKFLNGNSRFGKAFYVAENPGTAMAELAHHGATPAQGIRFSINTNKLKVLDLTDPKTAAKFGYEGGPISSTTQSIGAKAKSQGYNAIRFKSERGPGNNLAVLDDFNEVLTPQMVSPAQ